MQVTVKYVGSAESLQGVTSLPVKPLHFWHPTA